MEIRFEEEPKRGWSFLWILIFIILLLCAIGFYLLKQPFGQDSVAKIQNFFTGKTGEEDLYVEVIEDTKDEEIKRLQFALMQKEQELMELANSMKGGIGVSFEQGSKSENTLTNIRYVIKPKKQINQTITNPLNLKTLQTRVGNLALINKAVLIACKVLNLRE